MISNIEKGVRDQLRFQRLFYSILLSHQIHLTVTLHFGQAPSAPSALKVTSIDNGYTELNWQPATDNDQRNKPMYVIYASNEYPVDTKKAENIVAQSIRETSYIYAPIQPWNAKKYFAVTAIDRCGNESAPINGDK